MHIYFSGIGGTAIGPLAQIAAQAGHQVTGSDKQASGYIDYLIDWGITDIHIGQDYDNIAGVDERKPIDWLVYTSALTLENPNPPELVYCQEYGIKTSKRDELLNYIITEKQLNLIAIAGTHGKTTTTAMLIWLLKQLGVPISYSVGAKISFGDMGQFDPNSRYFIYEADEFDRNFLAFQPYMSIISGVAYDHHEIYSSQEEYLQAFRDFINQSQSLEIWQDDANKLGVSANNNCLVLEKNDPSMNAIKLFGTANRQNAWLATLVARQISGKPIEEIIKHFEKFPGLSRRMEPIAKNLYSDYAHTPEKISGGLSIALEMAAKKKRRVIVVYEPLTNRRQHYMINDYKDCFSGASMVYWVPSYLAREDPNQRVLEPTELISHLSDPSIAQPAQPDQNLVQIIKSHLAKKDIVVIMSGGGGGSLDEWIRKQFAG